MRLSSDSSQGSLPERLSEMIDKIVSVFVTALGVTALGIALRPQAKTADVIRATTGGFAQIQTAAFGPQ